MTDDIKKLLNETYLNSDAYKDAYQKGFDKWLDRVKRPDVVESLKQEEETVFQHILIRITEYYGITPKEIADAIDVHPPLVENWIAGTAVPNTFVLQRKVAKALAENYPHITGGSEDRLFDDIGNARKSLEMKR